MANVMHQLKMIESVSTILKSPIDGTMRVEDFEAINLDDLVNGKDNTEIIRKRSSRQSKSNRFRQNMQNFV